MTQSLSNRVALVTGASRGIGYATAKALAREGAHIIALARTVGGLEELDNEIQAMGGQATLVPMDLTDFDAIDRLGAAIYERWGRLDILIGNAGTLGRLTPLGHLKPKEWEGAFALNVTANWRLIRSLDLLMRRSDGARAVFMTSGAARSFKSYWGVYAATKAALETLVKTYANEVINTPIRVNLLDPGPVRTAMRAQAMPGEDTATLPLPEEIATHLLALTAPMLEHHGKILDVLGGKLSVVQS